MITDRVLSALALGLTLWAAQAQAQSAIGGMFQRSLGTSAPAPLPVSRRVDGNRILYDEGGDVRAFRAMGARAMILDGYCGSACLLTLGEGSCATSRGVLRWHSASDSLTGLPSPATNAQLMASYLPRLRALIESRGGIVQGGSARALAVLPRCPGS